MRAALADPDLREKLANINVDPTQARQAEFEALIRLETKKWADVINRQDHGRIRWPRFMTDVAPAFGT